jgi:ATP-dependent DNA helicase RecG
MMDSTVIPPGIGIRKGAAIHRRGTSGETLPNAVVHRDYTDPSDIQIKIFDDRITFFSPGGFYGGLTAAHLKTDHYPSRLRNKLVAEAFYLTNNIEKYGSGFIRIRKALGDYPEVGMELEEMGNGVLLTFVRAGAVQTVEDGPAEKGSEKSSEKILELLRARPGLSAKELAQIPVIPAKAGIQFLTSGPKGRESKIGARVSRPRFIQNLPQEGGQFLRRFASEYTLWIPAFAGMTRKWNGHHLREAWLP